MNRFILPALIFFATPLAADPLRVVTDIAPVHSLVSTVMGDLAEPDLLLPQGAEPHDFQLRPSQMRALSQADLVFWVGPDLTPWLERALTGVSPADPVALMDAPGTIVRKTDHALDPHAWLSPENGAVWLGEIAETLAQQDPENADLYRANAAEARARLEQTETEIEAQLAPIRDHGFIVFHDAYGYFTSHFALSPLGAVRESDSAPPSAARMTEINKLLASGKVRCAFAEATEDQDMMRDLVDGTDVGFGVLDPNGASLSPGPNLYFQLLRSQANALSDCLSGTQD